MLAVFLHAVGRADEVSMIVKLHALTCHTDGSRSAICIGTSEFAWARSSCCFVCFTFVSQILVAVYVAGGGACMDGG